MNRKQALEIHLEEWMLGSELMQLVEIYNIEATKEALLRGERPVIWLETYDEYIFRIADGRPMNIIANLLLWIDDGEKEIRINEHNYMDYYSDFFYKDRKGTYDIEEEL